ncbi:MAG: serine/threonine-protein kinase [Zavarzinella sp.]
MFEESELKRTMLGFADDHDPEKPKDELAPFRRYLQPGAPGSMGQISHFQILKVVGQGGFGTVVQARDLKLDRLVAIKMLDPRLAVTSAPRKYFLREARCAAKISHPNVVQIFAVEDSPTPYMVMEYIEGETLQDRLDRDGPLTVEQGIDIGRQVASGLEAAHQYGLIHRDIKPANILIEKKSEKVKITDFGVARAVDDASLTQSGAIIGTPMYMSPEQADGDAVDHRSDLFSLGSVLYTIFSGRPPFRAGNQFAVLKRVTEDRPRNILEVNPDLPEFISHLVNRLHEKNPQDRFQSAKQVLEALQTMKVEPTDTKKPKQPLSKWWYLVPCCCIIMVLSIIIAVQSDKHQPVVIAGQDSKNPPADKVEVPATPAPVEINGATVTAKPVFKNQKRKYLYDAPPYLNKTYQSSIVERVIFEEVSAGNWRSEVLILDAANLSNLIGNEFLGNYKTITDESGELQLQSFDRSSPSVKITDHGYHYFRLYPNIRNYDGVPSPEKGWWELIKKGSWVSAKPG